MLLAINIGNTNVAMGVFDNASLIAPSRAFAANIENVLGAIRVLIGPFKDRIDTVAIASVNPIVLNEIDLLMRTMEITPVFIGQDIAIPLDNLTDEPAKVGTDRLLNALAAYRRYETPVMIVDAGTATTIDVVDEFGRFMGGAIMPGPRASLDAMHHSTAALPQVTVEQAIERINSPARKGRKGIPEIGRNTTEAMIAGVSWSMIGAIEALRAVYERNVGEVMLIGTGGAIGFIPKNLEIFDAIHLHLTLEGIAHTIG